jgi:hypothetical protein
VISRCLYFLDHLCQLPSSPESTISSSDSSHECLERTSHIRHPGHQGPAIAGWLLKADVGADSRPTSGNDDRKLPESTKADVGEANATASWVSYGYSLCLLAMLLHNKPCARPHSCPCRLGILI